MLGLGFCVRVRVRVDFRVRVGVGVRINLTQTLTLTKTLKLNPNLLSYWECCRNMTDPWESANKMIGSRKRDSLSLFITRSIFM